MSWPCNSIVSPRTRQTRTGGVRRLSVVVAAGTLAVVTFLGCARIDLQSPDPLGIFPRVDAVSPQQASSHRSEFQIDRSSKALSWLLAHQVENGMTVAAVNEVLGESGELYLNDQSLKNNAGQYHQTDVGYRWGPDASGRSVVLFFRDGKLVNFDPEEF